MTDFSAELVAADGNRISLSGEQKVGRSTDCDITIDGARISRGHAMLRVLGDRLTVEDLGSANGTRVNEMPAVGEVALADGDIVCFEKHCYSVVITGGYQDLDATVVDSDATVVAIPEEVEPEPEPEPEPTKSETVPVEPAQPAAVDLPGSWVDNPEGGDHTRVLSMADMPEQEGEKNQLERTSDLPHLILINENGTPGELLELQPTQGGDPDVWEIGRDENCEIVLGEPSVSARHAQLSHDEGRWRLVNLVSKNGIYVNGEKRLAAYLSDGDEIRMGRISIVFRAVAGASAMSSPGRSAAATGGIAEKSSIKKYLFTVGVVILILAGLWLAL